MTVKNYLRACIWDFLICLLVASCTCIVNIAAFKVSEELAFNYPLIIGGTALVLALLFAAAYDKRTALACVPLSFVVLIVACLVGHSIFNTGDTLFDDAYGNCVPYFIVMYVNALVVFLLTRLRWLSRVFVLVLIIDVAFVEFMYLEGHVVASLISLLGAGLMVVYRNYRSNLRDASTNKVSFVGTFAVGGVYVAAVMGVACLIFFLIIAPMNPTAHEFKPFTKYMTYETIEMTGTGDSADDLDEDNKSDQQDDDTDTTQQDPDDGEDLQDEEDDSQVDLNSNQNPVTSLGELGAQLLETMQYIVNEQPIAIPFLLILLVVVITSPYWIKKLLRRRWFGNATALPPGQQVETFFLFFMKRLRMIKLAKGDNLTLEEYAQTSQGALAEFSVNPENVTFAELTQIYSKSVYSQDAVTEDEAAKFAAFYKGFYPAFVKKSGRFKYIFRFLRV